MRQKTTLDVGAHGVAVVTISNPPLNLLSVDVILSLKETIERAVSRDDVKAIVITGLDGKFSAGFDVTAFGGSQRKRTKAELGFMSIGFITDTLEAAKKPFIAAIDGPAFGGGLEVALACHARLATPSAQLGLTELKYGILPGLGGTQRLPRLVGLPKALEMILMSKAVNGEEAQRLSLVDALAPADRLLEVAQQWALEIVEGRRPWVISLYKTEKLVSLEEAKKILNSARLEIQRQNPNVMHPLVCIDVIEEGIVSDPRNALWKEAEALQELRQSSTCRSLVHIFFAQRLIAKVPGISKMNLLPRKIVNVAVIGGGFMSSDIATILVLRNYQVIVKEKNEKHLLNEMDRIKGNLTNYVKKGKATQEDLGKAFSLLKGTLDYDDFKEVDLVIEAESEDLSLKQQLFVNLENFCNPRCIFSSTSSTFSLKLVGEKTKCQDRIVQIHFFCPSPAMRLMEIIHMKSTSPQVVTDLIEFGRKVRKTPIIVTDCKGSMVNRMLVTYLRAAILLTECSVDANQIDRALESFGMQMGPFRLIDMIGFQAFALISKGVDENLPDRPCKTKLMPFLKQSDCDVRGSTNIDPEPWKHIKKARNVSNVTVNCKLTNLSDGEMVEMVQFATFNEACQILSEGIISRSSDLDVVSVLGLGFPAYRGGIVYWSDSLDPSYIHSRLEKWSMEYGELFKPCNYILEQSAKKISLAKQTSRAGKSQL